MESSHTSSSRSGASQASFHGWLAAFIEHLKQEGLTEGRIRCLRASARHFLVWLGQEDIDIGVIDDAVLRRFRRHDCRCPGMERERRKMLTGRSRQFVSGALRLVRFFEQSGRLQHSGELDEGLRLLEEFWPSAPGAAMRPTRSWAIEVPAGTSWCGFTSRASRCGGWMPTCWSASSPMTVSVRDRSRARASALGVGDTFIPSSSSQDSLPPGECCRVLHRRPGTRSSMRIWKHSASGFDAIAVSAKRRLSIISGGSWRCGRSSAPTRGGTTRHRSETFCCSGSQPPPGPTREHWPHRCACICASSPRAGSAPRRWSARFPPPPAGGCASCPDMFPPPTLSA